MNALCCTKTSYFHISRVLYSTEASFSKWVFHKSLKYQPVSLKASCFHSRSTHSSVKISNFHSGRVLHSKEASFIKWVSQNSLKYQLVPLKPPCFHSGSSLSPLKILSLNGIRGFCSEKTPKNSQIVFRSPRATSEAQAALIDYLHGTAGLDFTDAEHISKNSPIFLDKLLKKVEKEEDIGRALSRFLRYHPINEFEPFFESMGLKPSEFNSFLPRNLMFLKDDEEMLENYHALCNYGIARGKIGKMYKEATEIFRYKPGVLGLKLQAFEELGLSKTSVIKIVASSPPILIRDVKREFVKVLEELEDIGIQRNWIGGALSEKNFYNWGRMPILLHSCMEMGFTKQELEDLIRKHPDFMLDGSGKTVFSLVGLLLKVGATTKEIISLLTQFPRVQVGTFMKNLRRGLLFLIEIEMDPESIQKLLCAHKEFFGLHTLKKPNSLFTYLNVGKKRLCKIIKEDPHQLKKYVIGSKISRLPNSGDDERSLMQKKEFLLRLGFVEDSKEMQKALKVFRGRGDELQDRYDFLVKCGLDPNDVCNMIKMAPHVLNQKVDVLERKISFLENNLGFPLSSLVAFPSYMSYTVGRVKLRFLMYNWLKDRGKATPSLALSSVLACSDKVFRKRFISHHPQGPEMWENFKKALSSS